MKHNIIIVIICLMATFVVQGFFQESLATQVVNKSYTFLNIGENDTYETVSGKISGEFKGKARETKISKTLMIDLHERAYAKWDHPGHFQDETFHKSATNYYRSASNIVNVERIIDKQDTTMIEIEYLPERGNPMIQSIAFFFSKSNNKLLYYYVVFNPGSFDELSRKFTEKFGNAKLVLSSGGRSDNPSSGIGLYYWEQGNDCAYLENSHIMWNAHRSSADYLFVAYGSNIDEYVALIKQTQEQNIRKKSEKIDKMF